MNRKKKDRILKSFGEKEVSKRTIKTSTIAWRTVTEIFS